MNSSHFNYFRRRLMVFLLPLLLITLAFGVRRAIAVTTFDPFYDPCIFDGLHPTDACDPIP
jgi:hypothetical protein